MTRDSRRGCRGKRTPLEAHDGGSVGRGSPARSRRGRVFGLVIALGLGLSLAAPGLVGAAEESRVPPSSATAPSSPGLVSPTPSGPIDPGATDARGPAELVLPARRPSQGGGPGIESLLHLPSSFTGTAQGPEVAGATESGWRRRFRQTNESLAEARAALEATKIALDGAADGGGANQWSVAAPGGGGDVGSAANSGSPLSFKLRQALRKNRADLEAAERAMKELVIEADLAGVPEGWRGNPADSGDRPLPEVGQVLD